MSTEILIGSLNVAVHMIATHAHPGERLYCILLPGIDDKAYTHAVK